MQNNIPAEWRKKGGIYQIKNQVDGRVYIGSTVRFQSRYQQHLSCIKRSKHGNVVLSNAFAKYGLDSFSFNVIETVERLPSETPNKYKIRLLESEHDHIVRFGSATRKHGYNLEADPRQPNCITGADLVALYQGQHDQVTDLRYRQLNYQSKLNESQVIEIRIMLARGHNTAEVAGHFKVTKSLIDHIRRVDIWKNSFPTADQIDRYALPDFTTKCSLIHPEHVKEIKYLLRKGISISGINKFFGEARAGSISRGCTYADVVLTDLDISRFDASDLFQRAKAFDKERIESARRRSTVAATQSAERRSGLTQEQVLEIKELIVDGRSTAEIVEVIPIATFTMVQKIRIGRIWAHITGIKRGDFIEPQRTLFGKGDAHFGAKLTSDDVVQIRKELGGGRSASVVARIRSVSLSTVYSIKNGKTWINITV